MNVIFMNDPLPALEKSVLSVGNLDGIHNGHRFLITTVCERAGLLGAASVIITFEPHTRAFLTTEETPPRLTTFQEKALCMRAFPVDYLVCLEFNNQIARMSPETFISEILIRRFHAVEWVMGDNHTFGKGRTGTHNFLHGKPGRNHFNMFPVRLHAENGQIASSTGIRRAISERRIDDAVRMLGHPYLIIAERIRGLRKGAALGYPTLNFRCPPSHKVIPPPGVYAAMVEFSGVSLQGALYYGNCPTFPDRDFHFEFHSLDPVECDPAISTEAALWLYGFIRDDKHFDSELELAGQIAKDIQTIKHYFKKE
jgi:riboflavin kinase/FMN adenylyltransferase